MNNHIKSVNAAGPPGLRWIESGWAALESYQVNDALAHNVSSYRAYVAHIASPATEPGVGAGWQNVWKPVAEGAGDVEKVVKKVINKTGGTLLKGRAITAVGNQDGLVVVDYATAAETISAVNCFAVLQADLPDFDLSGVIGEAVIIGDIIDFNTAHLTAGTRTFLSNDVPATGLLTSTAPVSPDYLIEIGGTQISDPVNGKQFVTIENRGQNSGVIKIFNGAILEDHHVAVVSDGADVTATLTDAGAAFLSLFFNATFSRLTVPAATNVVPGTDTAPALNYVFIPEDTRVLTSSLVGFPTGQQYTPVATIICQSAASVQADGAYKVHAWTDHLADVFGQGHISHVNRWIREQHATWMSGVVPAFTGSGSGVVEMSSTAGNILQLHDHAFPAFPDPAEIFTINDFATPYLKTTNIASLIADSTGAVLTNKSFALVFWGVVSEDADDCKIMMNRPGGGYPAAKPEEARADLLNYTNYSIPAGYKGTGFLVHRMIASFNPAGTIMTIHPDPSDDIRGSFPNNVAGGAGAIDALPASSVTFTPAGLWASLEVQALGLEISDYITNPNAYQITGVNEQALDPVVLDPDDQIDIGADHYGAFELPATGTTNIDYTDLPINRSFYKTIDITAVSLAALIITAKVALDAKGDSFDISLWLADNLAENDLTRIIWHQVSRANGDQLINLSTVALVQ